MDVSSKHKIVFSMLSGLTFAILTSLMNYLFLHKDFNWVSFLFAFISFGLFFGLSYFYLMNKITSTFMRKILIKLNENEVMKHEGPANIFRGIEGVGGKLLLTDKRLIFKSHKLNIQSGETELLVEDIKEVIPRKTAKLFQNGIRIINKAGDHFDFVVYERDNWLTKIQAKN